MKDIRANLAIRLARLDERYSLEQLQRAASLASGTYRAALLANPGAIHLPARQIEAGEVWVAEVEGGVAGFCVVITRDVDEAELDGLFVEPTFWRRGLGTSLTAHAIDVACKQGANMVVAIAGTESKSFYEAQGFVVSREVPTQFDIALEMRRPLA